MAICKDCGAEVEGQEDNPYPLCPSCIHAIENPVCPHDGNSDCPYRDNCRCLGYDEGYPNCMGKRESAGTECNGCEFEFECVDSTQNGGENFGWGRCPHGGPH